MDIIRNRDAKTIFISQKKYAFGTLTTFDLQDCNPKLEPLPAGCKFDGFGEANSKPFTGPYREKIGKLLYLSVCTRPDIACAVAKLAQFVNNPLVGHNKLVNHLMGYIKGTYEAGLLLGGDINPIECYCDASHVSEGDLKSQSGYVIFLGRFGSPVVWSSKKQAMVTKSTMESELNALYSAIPNCMWIVDLLKELAPETFIPGPVPVYEDNEAAIAHIKKQQVTMRTQHYRRRYAWISQAQDMGDIVLVPIAGEDQTSDVFTKLLPKDPHRKHSSSLVFYADGSSPFEKSLDLSEETLYGDIEFEDRPIQWS
jgi:hypothetical protein